MNKKQSLLGILLASVTGATLFLMLFIRAFSPRFILPNVDTSMLILLSLIALVLDHYMAGDQKRNYLLLPIFAALIFGVFPLAACILLPLEALRTAILGAVIFTVLTFLFDSMIDRLSSSPATRLAPLISGVGLYLAAQCLLGMI